MSKEIVAKTFTSEVDMHHWMADEEKLAALKAKYPPPTYSGRMDLIKKQIIITKKNER